ncbi:MAG: glutamate synthase-related protein [Dehalococcoidia bacterium]|nr:glutamate synthase-related protein [Dehalococcoidia bacterium]MDD5493454.1 glutamate synthase-related protein [Dehalococcoidia bacterium]
MPDKYHIKTKSMPARRPKIGKVGIVDWREDCAGCRNCVKKACVFDRYRQEAEYIRSLNDMDSIFFQCMGCFSCVQQCTKGLLALSENPVYSRLGNRYWTPDIIETTWNQAETAKIPVSGAGYRGRFTGPGFDSMWTDMSEIVRPTRDGIHGREYISTAVDIGRKPAVLHFNSLNVNHFPLITIPMPLVIDLMPQGYKLPNVVGLCKSLAAQTGILMIVDYRDLELLGNDLDTSLPNLIFYIDKGAHLPPHSLLKRVRMVEIGDDNQIDKRISDIKAINPDIVVAIRVDMGSEGVVRAKELGQKENAEVIHLVADINGDQIGVNQPRFIKDMVREVHNFLVSKGIRNEITIIAGGGIALPEHMAKQIICGADLVGINLPLLIALECVFCQECNDGVNCPADVRNVKESYGVGRMVNLIAAWHDQLIEMMGAMGIREVRRLRGEVGRALFFEELEEATFGKLFGTRKN